MSHAEKKAGALPEANRKLPPIKLEIESTGMGLNYEAWPHRKNDVAFGWSRKPTAVEVQRAGRVHRIMPRRISGDRPGEFFLIYRTPVELDGWLLRERFLAIRTPEDALQFLRDTGPLIGTVHFEDPRPLRRKARKWLRGEGLGHLSPEDQAWFRSEAGELLRDDAAWLRRRASAPGRPPVEVTFSEIQLLQRAIKAQLTCPPNELEPEWISESPFLRDVLAGQDALDIHVHPDGASVLTGSGIEAIAATVTIDRAWGATFRCCRRHDCGQVFRVRDPRQVYCSYRCAHLVVVRNSRKSKRRARRSSR
jgi:hypothetical protein